jgi:hypothetical protein
VNDDYYTVDMLRGLPLRVLLSLAAYSPGNTKANKIARSFLDLHSCNWTAKSQENAIEACVLCKSKGSQFGCEISVRQMRSVIVKDTYDVVFPPLEVIATYVETVSHGSDQNVVSRSGSGKKVEMFVQDDELLPGIDSADEGQAIVIQHGAFIDWDGFVLNVFPDAYLCGKALLLPELAFMIGCMYDLNYRCNCVTRYQFFVQENDCGYQDCIVLLVFYIFHYVFDFVLSGGEVNPGPWNPISNRPLLLVIVDGYQNIIVTPRSDWLVYCSCGRMWKLISHKIHLNDEKWSITGISADGKYRKYVHVAGSAFNVFLGWDDESLEFDNVYPLYKSVFWVEQWQLTDELLRWERLVTRRYHSNELPVISAPFGIPFSGTKYVEKHKPEKLGLRDGVEINPGPPYWLKDFLEGHGFYDVINYPDAFDGHRGGWVLCYLSRPLFIFFDLFEFVYQWDAYQTALVLHDYEELDSCSDDVYEALCCYPPGMRNCVVAIDNSAYRCSCNMCTVQCQGDNDRRDCRPALLEGIEINPGPKPSLQRFCADLVYNDIVRPSTNGRCVTLFYCYPQSMCEYISWDGDEVNVDARAIVVRESLEILVDELDSRLLHERSLGIGFDASNDQFLVLPCGWEFVSRTLAA